MAEVADMPDPDPARSFGTVADAYDRGRPGYPAEAVAWLIGPASNTTAVLEVGAGTGKFTRSVAALGCEVFATDPDDDMLDVLSGHLPDVRATRAAAEQLPVSDRSVDVVVAAQAFHFFDLDEALGEMARVLKPDGHLGLIWNLPDVSIPWVRKLWAIMSPQRRDIDPTEALEASGYFGPTEHATFTFWQEVDCETLVDLALSRSSQILRSDAERAQVRSQVESLYADYGRGTGGMRIPYLCQAWRSRVTDKQPVTPAPPVQPTTLISSYDSVSTDTAVALPRVLDSYGRDEPGTDEVKLFTWH